ncbi:hypothetical protein PROFUN_05026 [Planoprotostelium fungivorum]|uniref:Uncharacterized protein n=1 Tax=Planoprotostelium fungivorum TaxID=1890364 RepID=A0A2P6NS70_9EUKA|nr:hypothetical protein PROFUN_05026 [Planoprotostelium fungivorum]
MSLQITVQSAESIMKIEMNIRSGLLKLLIYKNDICVYDDIYYSRPEEKSRRGERERERQRLYLGRLAMSFILDPHSHTFLALLLSKEKETDTQVRADVRRLALCGSPCSVETSRRSTGACTEQRELLVSLTVSASVSRSPQQ